MREHFQRPLRGDTGRLLTDCTVRLLEPGTTTPIPETIYVASTGDEARSNPWFAEEGAVDFFLDRPRVVRIGVTRASNATVETYFEDVQIGDEEVYKETFTFTLAGAASVQTGSLRYYVDDDCEIIRARLSCGIAPVGADLIADLNKGSGAGAASTIFANQADRLRVVDGAFTGVHDFATPYALAEGEYLTIDIDQVGVSTPGAFVVVQIRTRRLT